MTDQYQTGDYVRIRDHDGSVITVQITDSGVPNRYSDFMFRSGARMFKNSEILGLGDVPVISNKRKFEVGDKVYHPNYGQGTITIDRPNGLHTAVFADGEIRSLLERELFDAKQAPWPAVHLTPTLDTELHAEVEAENERARILSTAEKLINGDRADAYGHPKENFGRIAALWNAQLGKKLSEPLTAEDVAYALVQLKMSRLANTPGHEDSLVDVAGYIALAGELK